MKRLFSLSTLLLMCQIVFGQSPDMADTMRSEGKIYVVVGVVVLIFLVLFGYIIYLDLKLRKIEREK